MKTVKSVRLIIIFAVSFLFLVYNPLFCQWPTSGITVYVYVDTNTNGMECWDKRNGTSWKMTSQEIYDYVRSEVIGSLNSWRSNIGLTTSQLDFQLTTDPNQYPNQLYMIKVWFKDWSQFETPECWFGNIEPPDVPDPGDWEQDNAHVCNIFLNADKRRVSWLVGTDTPPRTLDTCMTYTKYYDIDLETVILHETGHTMGYGNHLPAGSGAVLEDGYHGSRKSLTCLDINTLRDLYLKPRTYYASAKNDFGGGYLKVNGVQRVSPVSLQWTQGSPPTLEAFDQEYAGEYRTYEQWYRYSGQPITNWPDFSIIPDEDNEPCDAETYTAKFGYRFNLTLNTPEYIDCSVSGSYYKVNGTNVGDSWNGYFIEGRDNPVTIEAVPGSNLAFIEWSDNGPDKYQNPRTFTPAGHTVFPVARFKGRLQSDYTISATESICPTCPNSQRKIDYASTRGKYQLTYESAGDIWFTEAANKSGPWSSEVRIASSATNPCLASDGNLTYIVYLKGSDIVIKKYNGTTWSELNFTIPQGHLPASDAMPVIEVDELEKIIFVVWKNQNNTLSYYCSYDDGTDDETGFVPLSVARSYPYVLFYPSIGHAPGSQRYEVAWREDWQSVPVEPRVFHQTVQVSTNNPPLSLTFLGDEEISNYWQDARQAPSVTVDMSGHPSVSWGAYDIYHGYIINFRQKLAAGWGTMATMIAPPNSDNDLYWAPSVSGFSNVQWQDGLRIAHNWTDNTDPQNPEYWIVVQRLQSGSWVEQDQTQDALHPNLTPFTTTNDILQVYPDESTVCGAGINELFFTQANLQKRSNVLASQRELVIRKDTTFFLSRLGELVVREGSNKIKLDWNTGFDTLVVGKTTTVGDYLRTKTFTVASNSRLKYRTVKTKRGSNVFPDSMYLRLQLVDASSNVVLATLNTFHPRTIVRGRHDKRHVFDLKNYIGKDVYVRMILEGKDSTTSLSAINYYYDPDKYLPKSDGYEEFGTTDNVSTYELSLNYPNPFGSANRGVTEIRYSVPEPGDVRLAVYDLLGREVSILVEGYQPAGKHTVRFKAGNIPAGLYLYRLNANGVQLTRKMMIER